MNYFVVPASIATSLPPRGVYTACLPSNVQWFDWIAAGLGRCEFDFHVDLGCISVQFGRGTELITIWLERPINEAVLVTHHTYLSQLHPNKSRSKTLVQQLLGNDRIEDEELLDLIADEVSAPTWTTPVVDHFPASTHSESPLSTISSDSCSSYCSPDLCSCFSFTAASTLSSKKIKKQSSQLTRRGNQGRIMILETPPRLEIFPTTVARLLSSLAV
ncbi:hypothetical protein EDD22DRAFT_994222 [Suillus occidentalis]|nr:hypothetical protein EDD22DRAFT_994222 [Suillus occidentalis]